MSLFNRNKLGAILRILSRPPAIRPFSSMLRQPEAANPVISSGNEKWIKFLHLNWKNFVDDVCIHSFRTVFYNFHYQVQLWVYTKQRLRNLLILFFYIVVLITIRHTWRIWSHLWHKNYFDFVGQVIAIANVRRNSCVIPSIFHASFSII